MTFAWEEIFDNGEVKCCAFFEATYRAKVIGGWLIRHQTFNDYQYACGSECNDSRHRHIDDEGYQNVASVMTFLADPDHKWEIE